MRHPLWQGSRPGAPKVDLLRFPCASRSCGIVGNGTIAPGDRYSGRTLTCQPPGTIYVIRGELTLECEGGARC